MSINIKLSPVWAVSEEPLTLEKQGEGLIINGVLYDFSEMGAGDILPDAMEATGCEYILGDVEKTVDGNLQITLKLPHGVNAQYPALFPMPISVSEDGPVELPDAAWPEPEPEEPINEEPDYTQQYSDALGGY